MKQFLKRISVLIILLLVNFTCFSQLNISYYNSSTNKIGLGYNFSDQLWSELRLYDSTSIFDLSAEFVVCYNIVKKDRHDVYLGIGGIANPYYGLIVPVGIQFYPIEKFKRFSLHIEFQPIFDFGEDVILQSSWGLKYRFGKKYLTPISNRE